MSTHQPPATFAELLRRLRRRAGLTQAELAERAGLAWRGISDLERGARTTPHRETVERLADALGLHDDERAEFAAAARGRRVTAPPTTGAPDQPAAPGLDAFTLSDDLATRVAAVLSPYVHALPAAGEPRPPRDLPPRAPGFIGREAELQVLVTALRAGEAVAVVGMGGLGKSALAAEVVCQLAAEPDSFPGGITWVRGDERVGLEGLIWSADQLLAAWEAALPAEATARAASLEEGLALRERALQRRLRPTPGAAQARALVLFDNVEAGWPLERLLETAQPLGLTLLLTMRSEPASPRLRLLRLETLASEAAIQLFAVRYTSRGGQWEAARDREATVAIVAALDGLPLAIELAATRAARLRLPLVALAKQLHGPALLARLSDPLTPSASVRYSLGKTLRALSPPQRMRFAALGLPEGPDWALPLIERMLEAVPASSAEPAQGDREGDRAETPPHAQAHAELEALLAYSLVSLVAPQETSATGMLRVRLHPLVRELAREEWMHLPGSEQEAALGGLLAGVRVWLVRYRGVSATDIATLASDEELIAGAVREAVARHVELPRVVAIVKAWGDYLYPRNLPLDREMAELQLESARRIDDRRAEVDALRCLAREVGLAGQKDERTAYWQAALAIADDLGDQFQVLNLLSLLGGAAARRGVRAEAERMYEKASATAHEQGDQLTDGLTLLNLGTFARVMGRFEEAERWYLRALESVRAAGNFLNERMVEADLGFLYEQMGHTAAAQRLFEALLPTARAYGTRLGIGMVLNALGQLALRTGDLATAARDLAEALSLLEQSAAAAMVVHVHGNLAILAGLEAQRRGDQEDAARAFEEALRLFDQNGPEQCGEIATDQRSFVRHLLAELQEQPAAGAPALPSKPSTASPPFPRR